MSNRVRVLLVVAGMVLLGALVTACGGSSGSSSESSVTEATTSESTESSGAGSAEIAEAEKVIEDHSNLEDLKWPKPPQKPFDAGTGKIGVVVCSTAGTGCVTMGKQVLTAAKAAGWETTELEDGKFSPSVQNGIIQRFVQEKLNGIILVSMEVASVKSGVAAAEKAGIPMACVFCAPSPGFPAFGGPVPSTVSSGSEQGELAGAYMAVNHEGTGHVNLLVDHAFPINVERAEGVVSALEKYCSECDVEEESFATVELTKPGPPSFNALLAAHPAGSGELEWVTAGGPSDTYIEPMYKTAEQQGRTELKFFGADAESAVLQNISEGGLAQATLYSPFPYATWSAVDEVVRQAAGLKPWKADELPTGYITPENVAEPLKAADNNEPWAPKGFNFKAMFEKLWSGS